MNKPVVTKTTENVFQSPEGDLVRKVPDYTPLTVDVFKNEHGHEFKDEATAVISSLLFQMKSEINAAVKSSGILNNDEDETLETLIGILDASGEAIVPEIDVPSMPDEESDEDDLDDEDNDSFLKDDEDLDEDDDEDMGIAGSLIQGMEYFAIAALTTESGAELFAKIGKIVARYRTEIFAVIKDLKKDN